ncbi:MAG TPA: hypothetical protein VI837_02755 [Blastocatellia bacterium]|nr:hypothetical protein [Blastocatellia bacterium]
MNSQRKAWVAFLIVFALGGVTGASLDGIYRLRANATASSPAVTVSIRDTDAYFETLKRELALNDDQSSAMRAILDRTRDDYKAVCADVRPRYDVVRERARGQMRALLTADQQPRFDSIVTAEDCRCPELKK